MSNSNNTIIENVAKLTRVNATKVNTLQNAISGLSKKSLEIALSKFEKQMKQGELMNEGRKFIDSEDGKKALLKLGIDKLTRPQLFKNVYGFECHKWPTKIIQASNFPMEARKDYLKQTKETNTPTDLKKFITFAKEFITGKEPQIKDEKIKEVNPVIITFQDGDKKIITKIDSKDNIKSPLSYDEFMIKWNEVKDKFEQASLKAKMNTEFNLTAVES